MSQLPLVIAFSGKIGSGKSTAAELLLQAWPEEPGRKVKMYAFARPLKDAMKAAFGFSEEQLYGEEKELVDLRYGVTPRHILQKIGTDWFRDRLEQDIGVKMKCSSLWVERFRQYVIQNQGIASLIIVEDCRFADEAQAIHECGGVIIRLLTTEEEEEKQGAGMIHSSEQGNFDVDAVIVNEKKSKVQLLANIFEVVSNVP